MDFMTATTRKVKLGVNSAINPMCKLCRLSIQPGQPRVWLRKPMGVSHTECADFDSTVERVS